MKLRRIEVENYGLFSEQAFDFDASFSLVFGPNEAGKSTLLQLIREQLFGFGARNAYAFSTHAGEMAATAELELADGERLRYRRRKGNKNVVKGELLSGKPIDEAGFKSLLGGMTQDRYEHLFGFSLAELTAGQESLNEANIGEALYGGAIGGLSHLQRIRGELQTEADAIFTPRGRTKIVDGILKQLKEKAKEQRSQVLKPRDYERLVDDCKTAAADTARLQDRVDKLRHEAAYVARVASALDPWLRFKRASEELATLNVPPDFPTNGAEQLASLQARHTELVAEEQQIAADLREEIGDLDALRLAPELIDREADIRHRQQQIKQIESCRLDLPKLAEEAAGIKATVAAKLRELHPNWDQSSLDQFENTLAQRETVDRLKRERESLDRERDTLIVKRRAIEADIASLQQQLEQIETPDAPGGLAALLDESSDYQRNRERLRELRDQLTMADEELETALAKVNAPLAASSFDGVQSNDALPIPLATTIEEFRDRRQQLDEQLRAAEQQAGRTERELAEKQSQLEQLDSQSSVPDREHLVVQRKHRDAGWQLLRRELIDGEPRDDDAIRKWAGQSSDAAALADGYERAVSDADRIADERQEKYEQAAKRDQLSSEINRLRRRLASEREAVDARRRDAAQEQARWETLWEACPFEPLSPDAMIVWLRDYASLAETNKDRRVLLRRIEDLGAEVTAFESRLSTCLPGEGETPTALLATVKERVEAARKSAVRRQAYEEQLPQKQQALRAVTESLTDLETRDEAWRTSWEALLDDFGFPREWDVHVAARILAGLAEARGEADKAQSLDKRICDMQQEVAAFESQIGKLCDEIAPDLNNFLAEHAIGELFDRLGGAKQDQRDHERLTQSTAKLERRLSVIQAKLETAEQEHLRLLSIVDSKSEQEFSRVAEEAERFAELCRVSDEADREIKAIRATADANEFAEELCEADADSCAARCKRLEAELAAAEGEANAAMKQQTLLDNRRDEMEGGSRAAELAQDIESSRGQLAAAVDSWAPLVLAQALMKRAIDKFEREHQPAVIAAVGELLAKMTLGRYRAIERKLDEHGTLLIVDEAGTRKAPHQLSTGTREQLYLAIRLAYIQHYCRDAEPLPIVMDDVLVNFDAKRAKQTFQVLADLSSSVQIIFLTCHEHIVNSVAEAVPGCEPIVLPGGVLPGDVIASRVKPAIATK